MGRQRQRLDERLGGKHSVEWIAVGSRQSAGNLCMSHVQCQRLPAIVADHLIEPHRQLSGDNEFAKAIFGCDLMAGYGAYDNHCASI